MIISDADTATARASRPVLPDALSFNHLVELIERHACRAFGIGFARREALLRMMRSTAVKDWTDPGRDPVCFRAQQDLAAELGITDRALRAHERQLEAIGLLAIDTAADGHRSGVELAGGRRLGLNLAPLIGRIAELMEIDALRRAEGRRFQALRLECSALKRDLRRRVEEMLETGPKHPAVTEALRSYASWPRRYASFRTIAGLEAHLQEIQLACDRLSEARACRAESSGVAEAGVPAIQKTILKISVSSGGSSARRLPEARPRTMSDLADHAPAAESRTGRREPPPETRCRPEAPEAFSADQLYRMASDDMRLCLDMADRGDGMLTERAFIRAAIAILPDLGIHPSAWEEAAETMGNLAAALVVLIVDANRFRTVNPVRKPGAMLRVLTRSAQRGNLNLQGSLMALRRWKLDQDGGPLVVA